MRWRLIAIIIVPAVAALVMGGLQVAGSMRQADQYQLVMDRAQLGETIYELIHNLSAERDQAVRYISASRAETRLASLQRAFGRVDTIVATVTTQAARLDPPSEPAGRIVARLEQLPLVRDLVLTSELPALSAMARYDDLVTVLQEFNQEIARDSPEGQIKNTTLALAALSRAKDQAARLRSVMTGVLLAGELRPAQLNVLIGAQARVEGEVATYRQLATVEQRQLYHDTVTGQKIDQAELYRMVALTQAENGRTILDLVPGSSRDAELWSEAACAKVDAMRLLEQRLMQSIHVHTLALRSQAHRDGGIAALATGAMILLVLLVALAMARSLVRPLRRLRSEALQIANERLPETVRMLREHGEHAAPPVEPIGVHGDDEVGDLARAFDEVHREAVRLAQEEAGVRANVNAMFVNLSRRSQALVERQITLIDSLEQGEWQPDTLTKLDLLATRMRRNGDNLLVLAGQDPVRRWTQPVRLSDIAVAVLEELEDSERVSAHMPDGVAVSGEAANDLVHLLAELAENALAYSPLASPVTMAGSRFDGGGIMVALSDVGIGMTPDEVLQANQRLAHAAAMDVTASRRMGHFVVARLARRHRIRVQVRANEEGGLTALVLLPSALLTSPVEGGLRVRLRPRVRPVTPPWPPDTTAGLADLSLPLGAHPLVPEPGGSEDDFLPIFASVQSAWFGADGEWGSAKTDEGWNAAAVVGNPVKDPPTAAGLPKRVPKANLVPGSAPSGAMPRGVTPTPTHAPASLVRSRLNSFQEGVRAAKADISEGRL
ncbi:sensor histidine kinase [Nonomuraea soli]|uniref:histidine kinase n=1 Tax=Nonomuraea soli TaxID=1032476 RepID=A0A7W0CL92_9ACTN|nr:nitrate- and nitrite sensing domain-containing protein [Nonomuraea soli]MBA2893262.1 HAMP domain-containing protein [Nonomuraea soli]